MILEERRGRSALLHRDTWLEPAESRLLAGPCLLPAARVWKILIPTLEWVWRRGIWEWIGRRLVSIQEHFLHKRSGRLHCTIPENGGQERYGLLIQDCKAWCWSSYASLSVLGVSTVRDLCTRHRECDGQAQIVTSGACTLQGSTLARKQERDGQYIWQQWGRIPYTSQEKGVVDVSLDENFIPQKLSPQFGCKV